MTLPVGEILKNFVSVLEYFSALALEAVTKTPTTRANTKFRILSSPFFWLNQTKRTSIYDAELAKVSLEVK
jgi:hypothetical protein